MLEESKLMNQVSTVPTEIELIIDRLVMKQEPVDKTIIQLKGKLVRGQVEDSHFVIALHITDELGQYIHLQQYEFEYRVNTVFEKAIDISVVVLGEVNVNKKYDVEIKLLTNVASQQWKTIQSYTKKI